MSRDLLPRLLRLERQRPPEPARIVVELTEPQVGPDGRPLSRFEVVITNDPDPVGRSQGVHGRGRGRSRAR